MSDPQTEWPLWEVFVRSKAGLDHKHCGSLHAADPKMAIQNAREWRRFCADALGQPALADDPRFASNSLRCANRPALDAAIDSVFGVLSSEAVIARLMASTTAYASLNEVADLSHHPQLRRVDAATPTGPVSLPAPPLRWSDGVRPALPIPGLGANGAAIRAEFA